MGKRTAEQINLENEQFAKTNGKEITSKFTIASVFHNTSETKEKDTALMITVLECMESGRINSIPETARVMLRVEKDQLITIKARTFAEKCFTFGITKSALLKASLKCTVVTYPKGTDYVDGKGTVKTRENDVTLQHGDYTVIPDSSAELIGAISKGMSFEEKIALAKAL